MYIYVYMCIYVYMYVYMCIERKGGKEGNIHFWGEGDVAPKGHPVVLPHVTFCKKERRKDGRNEGRKDGRTEA